MRKVVLTIISLLLIMVVVAAGYFWSITQPTKPPKSQAFINGQVLTMDANNRIANALLLNSERIIQLGSTEEILQSTTSNTVIHDLGGRTLMPGFIDAHGHFPGSGAFAVSANLNAPPIGNVSSIAELKAALSATLKTKNKNEWLFGMGYDDTLIAEKRHPTRQDLDMVSTDHPIYIMHVSGHLGVANTAALERLNISASTQAPEGGIIDKDASGQLTGLLKETATTEIMAEATDFSLVDTWQIVRSAAAEYASQGVTTVQNGAADKRMVVGLKMATRFNVIPQRVEVWPLHTTLSAQELESERADNNLKMNIGAIKIVADGSIQAYTAYLSRPYHVVPSSEEADYRGHSNQKVERLNEWVMDFHKRGLQLALHGNGDAAIEQILNAVQAAQKVHPIEDPRHILIHAQMARQDQLERMQDLGITPSFFSAHTYYWGDRHQSIFMGPERAAFMSPAKASEDLGLRYTIHLDAPVVPMQPLRLVWSAVNRLSFNGNVIGAEQRISPMNALRATTIDAAWQIFKQEQIGSLEVGKLADLVILNDDPLTDTDKIADLKVDATYVGGNLIYKRTR